VVLYAAQPDLAHAPIPDRILGALDEGEKSVASLSESLGVSEPVVRSALARLEKRGIVDRVDDGLSGRGKKALWIRIDEKRSRLGE
jgi:DNA-binding transcriptional ArsR family regulator